MTILKGVIPNKPFSPSDLQRVVFDWVILLTDRQTDRQTEVNVNIISSLVKIHARHQYTVAPAADKERSVVAVVVAAAAENNNGDIELVMHGPSSVSSRAVRTSPAWWRRNVWIRAPLRASAGRRPSATVRQSVPYWSCPRAGAGWAGEGTDRPPVATGCPDRPERRPATRNPPRPTWPMLGRQFFHKGRPAKRASSFPMVPCSVCCPLPLRRPGHAGSRPDSSTAVCIPCQVGQRGSWKEWTSDHPPHWHLWLQWNL